MNVFQCLLTVNKFNLYKIIDDIYDIQYAINIWIIKKVERFY